LSRHIFSHAGRRNEISAAFRLCAEGFELSVPRISYNGFETATVEHFIPSAGHHRCCNKVKVAVIENNIHVERWMLGEEDRKSGHDVQPRKGEGSAEAQAARREFRFVGLLDGASRTLESSV
jgi:hypothetical protein